MTVATIGGAYALYSGTAKTVENKFNIVAGADHGTEGFDPSNPDGPTDGTDGTVEEGNWGTVDEDSDGQPDDINGDGMIDENDKPDTDVDGIYDSADDLEPRQKVLINPSITSNVNYESWIPEREIRNIYRSKKIKFKKRMEATVLNDSFKFDYNAAVNYWLNKDKHSQKMPRQQVLERITAFIEGHNTCTLATASEGHTRCTPIEYNFVDNRFYFFSEGGLKFRGLKKISMWE